MTSTDTSVDAYVHAYPTAEAVDQTIRVFGPFGIVQAAEQLVMHLADVGQGYVKVLITNEPTPIAAAQAPTQSPIQAPAPTSQPDVPDAQTAPTIPAPAPTAQTDDPSTTPPSQV